VPRVSPTLTSELSISAMPLKAVDICFARSGQSRFATAGRRPAIVVSSGFSREKSGTASMVCRFWNAAFVRANTLTARL
jgi:hypothetical protein